MVQRRAARFVKRDYRKTSSVTSIMSELGWESLESRRKVSRPSLFAKAMHGAVAIPLDGVVRQNRSTNALVLTRHRLSNRYQPTVILSNTISFRELSTK